MKTNGRHIGILLPVSILTYSASSACPFASAYQPTYCDNYKPVLNIKVIIELLVKILFVGCRRIGGAIDQFIHLYNYSFKI